MEFDPPSAMTRFGMFFLAGGVAMVFAMWGVLKWIDKPPPPTTPVKAPVVTPAPAVPPPPLASPTPFPASPPPSAVPASPAPM